MAAAEESMDLERSDWKRGEADFKKAVIERDQRRYSTAEARSGAEQKKRQRLRAEIQRELNTPLAGCKLLSKTEREDIHNGIAGRGLILRGIR